jgi:hypothetical protein
MNGLSGNWSGIVGGTNIGKVSAKLTQSGNGVTGYFTFHDLVAAPVQAQLSGALAGRWLDGTLSQFKAMGVPPVGVRIPQSGRLMGLVEEAGAKITGFWMTDILTTGGFILTREE